MNKCIYLNESDSTQEFKKQEHIFPAGIGGIKKLPRGYVSDHLNGIVFSKLEMGVMRESVLAISRMFQGPGKRGSLSNKKEGKSKISVFEFDDEKSKISLGYIKKGHPYQIPQIAVKAGENVFQGEIILDYKSKNAIEERERFLKKIVELDNKSNLKIIIDKRLGKDDFILGEFGNKWYMAVDDNTFDFENIKNLINKIVEQYGKGKVNKVEKCGQVSVNISLNVNLRDFYRVSAKIIFNYLAYVYGQDFVLHEQFDKIRKYILGDNNHINIRLIEELNFMTYFPDESHMVIITRTRDSLCAVISYYGGFPIVFIELCDNYKDNFNYMSGIGYICDWKNRKEYSLVEYINEYYDDKNVDIENDLLSKINY